MPAHIALLSTLLHAATPAAMTHEARYRIECSEEADAKALREALAVEARDALGGAVVRVRPGDGPAVFHLEIEAADVAHLRATTNSYLKWLGAAADTLTKVQGGPRD